jgi:hypothetical protein
MTVERALTIAVGILIAAVMGFGGLLVYDTHGLRSLQKAGHKNTVTSRFDASYVACLNSNNGNVRANRDFLAVLNHPFSLVKRHELLNDIRPLRLTTSPVVPLPKVIPRAWVVGCTYYAASQLDEKIPAHGAPLPSPSVTNPTKSNS